MEKMTKKEYLEKQKKRVFETLKKDNKMLIDLLGNNFTTIFTMIDLENDLIEKEKFYDTFDKFIKFLNAIDNA